MTSTVETLPEGHRWLRVADPQWADPLDPTHAARAGGRWNPPGSFPTLYLNEDLRTARAQITSLLRGSPVDPEDLDGGYDLIVATLPRSQRVANAIEDDALEGLGLPVTYPHFRNGRPVTHATCQPIGRDVFGQGLRGVHARSAAIDDGSGRELAWFPARSSSRATHRATYRYRDWWYFDPE